MKTETMKTEELLERLSLGRERLGQIPQEARLVPNGALPEQEKQEKGEVIAAIPSVHQFSQKIHEHEIRSSPLT